MIETNIRVVDPGATLQLTTRVCKLVSQVHAPDSLAKACSMLRRRGRASVEGGRDNTLLVLARGPLAPVPIGDDDWYAEIQDAGLTHDLTFQRDPERMSVLLERMLLIRIQKTTDLWTLDSPRILYEPRPCNVDRDLAAYRRFEISAVPIACTGVGLVVDVGTAFFTVPTVADFFAPGLQSAEARRRRAAFDRYSRRQHGQRGTLVNDVGVSHSKCYFNHILDDVTCGTTEPVRVAGKQYESLYEYYRSRYPKLDIGPDDAVAMVSFPGLERPKPVAAKLLRVRVANEALPHSLRNVDKIAPDKRATIVRRFWRTLGPRPLGENGPMVSTEFWRPTPDRLLAIPAPSLAFGNDRVLTPPAGRDVEAHQRFFKERRRLLDEVGCFRVPPAIPRRVPFVLPRAADDQLVAKLAADFSRQLCCWTKKRIVPDVIRYSTLVEAFRELMTYERRGLVVFVFDDEDPATYHTIARELNAWRVKRLTAAKLRAAYRTQRWKPFISHSALDALQHLDCVPWALATHPEYDVQLVIDVGRDRRHFALSLLITPSDRDGLTFWLDTTTEVKPDVKQETINHVVLQDRIVAMFRRAAAKGVNVTSLQTALAVRDGRESGREQEGIEGAFDQLVQEGLLASAIQLAIVDFHKRSVKSVRLWNVDEHGRITNALEGSGFLLDESTAVLTNTGAATLRQGTAEPVMLVMRGQHADLRSASSYIHATAQLNWSSPGRAQRLTLPLKRTDDELKNRASQEIRRIT